MPPGLGQIIIRLASGLVGIFWTALFSIAALFGLIVVARTLRRLIVAHQYGQSGAQATPGFVMTGLVVGALIANLAQSVKVMSQSYGDNMTSFGAVAYASQLGVTGTFTPIVDAALTLVSMFGGLMFYIGLSKFARATSGDASGKGDLTMTGFWNVVFGSFLINIQFLLAALHFTILGV